MRKDHGFLISQNRHNSDMNYSTPVKKNHTFLFTPPIQNIFKFLNSRKLLANKHDTTQLSSNAVASSGVYLVYKGIP